MIKNRIKKSIAGILVGALVCSGAGINKLSASAANTKTYISEVKLIKGNLSKEDQAKYEEKGYKFIKQTTKDSKEEVLASLSEGGGGTPMYMAYKTTTDPKDAIRDIAFMQMKGNYSASAYKKVLEDNMELAKQNVEEFKSVIEEFRTNYNSPNAGKMKLAKQAYDLLNKYYEEDTKLGMGDFFLNADGKVTEENYVTLAMQATSTTLSTLISIIAKGCDPDENATWLDRLVKYNGFDGLARECGYNPDNEAGKKMAIDKLEQEYGDMIKYLTDDVQYSDVENEEDARCAWDEFAQGLKTYANSLDKGLDELASKEEKDVENVEEFVEQSEEIATNENSVIYGSIYETLSSINYKDGTLADLFMKTADEMQKEDFYPVLAALSVGQRTVVLRSGFSVLFTSAGEQKSAKAVNTDDEVLGGNEEAIQNETGESIEAIQENSVNNQVANLEETINEIENEMPDEIAGEMIVNDKISVYAGVDRGFFGEGVAMTTSAQDKDSEGGLKSKKSLPIISYITGSIGMASIVSGATLLALGSSPVNYWNRMDKLKDEFKLLQRCKANAIIDNNEVLASGARQEMLKNLDKQDALRSRAAFAESRAGATYKIVGTALLVVGLALTTYAIVEAVMTLVKKDDPKYTEIPLRMVDSSNGEKKDMEDFLYYNAVQNDSGAAQDLNDWTSGMWLSMYVSKTKDAGDPIIADSFKIQGDANNTAGMKSAHLFGETGAYNMLTYSKNSGKKLFMYFEKDEPSNAGSIFGKNTLITTSSLFAIFCGVIIFEIYRSKKKKRLIEA